MAALLSTKLAVCLSTIAILTSAVGCGDDEKSPTPSSTAGSGGSGGSSATGGSGGSTGGSGGSTGGSGGTGGSTGGSGGTTGDPDSGVVSCGGGVTCAPQGTPPFTIPACCTPQGTCGIQIASQCFDTMPEAGPIPEAGPPGVPDPSCGTIDIFGLSLAGCCLSDNSCGYSSPIPGLGGCLSFAQLSMFPGIMLPEGGPLSCVYPPTAR